MMNNPMEDYIRIMSEPVISRKQPASLLFFAQENLSEALRLIELSGLKTLIHMEDQGVASVYLYLDDELTETLRDLSTIGFNRPEYYQEAAMVLGIEPSAVSRWTAHHPAL